MSSSIFFIQKTSRDGPLYISSGISRVNRLQYPNYDVFQSKKSVLLLANSAYPDEMVHQVALYHCLPKRPGNKLGGD